MSTLENDITEAIFAAEDALQHLYQAKTSSRKQETGVYLISSQVVLSPLSSSTNILKMHKTKSDMRRLL